MATAAVDPAPAAEPALARDEVRRRIRRASWGVLAVEDAGRPYAVPRAYGYDGRRFFVATSPGRKRRALEGAPLVCFTIVEAESPGYVVVLGRALPVTSLLARLRAGFLILQRFSRGGLPSLGELRRMARGRIFRIDPHEVSGRAHAT